MNSFSYIVMIKIYYTATLKLFSTIYFSFFSLVLISQDYNQINLRDIWVNLKFHSNTLEQTYFTKSGSSYSLLEENAISEYDLISGNKIKTFISGSEIQGLNNFMGSIGGYEFSPDEDNILLQSESEKLNRRTVKSRYHIYNIRGKTINPLFSDGKVSHPSFSPDGNKVAFINDYNLFFKDLKQGSITQITFDGDQETILNGTGDWVMQEEFYLDKAYEWSPNGSMIAFCKIDQSDVPSHPLISYQNQAYPTIEYYKYPKPGLTTSSTSLHMYNNLTGKTHAVDIPVAGHFYIPYFHWIIGTDQLIVVTINRQQNEMRFFKIDAKLLTAKLIYEEYSLTYVEPPRKIISDIKDRIFFLSFREGFSHIIELSTKSGKLRNLTPSFIHVDELYGINDTKNELYFSGAEKDHKQRHLYKYDFKTGNAYPLTVDKGYHEAWFNHDYSVLIMEHSKMQEPPSYTALNINMDTLRIIEENSDTRSLIVQNQLKPPKFFSFKTDYNVTLEGWMILPPTLDDEKEYPLIMYVYGGPGSQEVTNKWRGLEYWWFQMMAQKGYIIACVDNRGTTGRGLAFKNSTHGNLGYYEVQDQLAAVKYLSSLGMIDADRIGIYGWSYGGYMAIKCLIDGSQFYSMAVSVAPVADWRWFNAIYAERHLQLPGDNPQGYFNSNLLSRIHRLEDPLLIIHGLTDDIVHFQHTAELTKALINYNKEYDTYLYPNRNHGIYGDNARYHLYSRMTDYILSNL